MRMLLPPLRERRAIDKALSRFFLTHKIADFRQAITRLCDFYQLKRPRFEWYAYLDWGKTAGRTYQDGSIHLMHPEYWKRGRKYNSERQWINMVYHEMGHYVFWVDAERKANAFAQKMVRGVKLQQ